MITFLTNRLRQPGMDDAKLAAPSIPNRPALVVAGTAAILIAVLAAGGPFFDPAQGAATHPVVLQFIPGDGQIVTANGKLDRDAHAFISTQSAGALMYGPYIGLQPGRYVVTWTGKAGADASPKFDVFSAPRGVIASGNAPAAPGSATLQRIAFELEDSQSEIEFRTFVEAGDDVSIDGISLEAAPLHAAGRHE